jgi:multidrug resistance efflux pump
MGYKSWAVVGLVLAAVVAGLGFYWPWGQGPKTLTLPGTVEVHEVRLGPRIAGRVKKVHVGEGATVQPGQPLVELDVPELEARRAMLQAKLAQAVADHKKAKDGARPEEKRSAQEMALAAKARWEKLKNGYRDEEKRQAKSEHDVAVADLRLAEQDLDKARQASRGGASTQAELDTVKAALNRCKARLALATARWDLMKAGPRPEEIEEARAEYQRLKAAHELVLTPRQEDVDAARGREEEARSALAELEVNIREATVRAVEPCVVELVPVRPGDLVVAGQPVARALRTGDLWVKTYVPETELGRLRLNQEVQVTSDSLPGKYLTGRIVHIGAESEFTPRNVQTVDERKHQMFGIRVKVEDPHGHFKSGMAAEVVVPLAD